jgi:predicted nucleotidyltransferase
MKGFCLKPSFALNQKRTEIRELVAKFPTLNPRVFGSVVFGNDKEGSDLDLLVDTLPGLTLFDLGALQYELEEMLGVSVDLLTPGDLPMKFRNLVLAQAQAV